MYFFRRKQVLLRDIVYGKINRYKVVVMPIQHFIKGKRYETEFQSTSENTGKI